VTHKHAQLDQLGGRQQPRQALPRLVAELAPVVELVDRNEQQPLSLGPFGLGRLAACALDRGPVETRPRGEAFVMAPLVLAVRAMRHAQDDELRVGPGQAAARHQPAREPQPAAEQPAVAPEREEEVERRGARDAPADAAQSEREEADLTPAARGDPRTAHPTRSACGVVSGASSSRATSSAS
jgi:hypothetical protein